MQSLNVIQHTNGTYLVPTAEDSNAFNTSANINDALQFEFYWDAENFINEHLDNIEYKVITVNNLTYNELLAY
jgi:hypothetical protein